MPDSTYFERACVELGSSTELSREEARGTLRIALKKAGYEAGNANRAQVLAVILHTLPEELAARGTADARTICQRIADRVAGNRIGTADAE
jgi:hypothetical protein